MARPISTEAPEGLALRLRRAREERGFKQSELAKTAGIKPSVVSRIESGKILNPHMKTIAGLEKALGVRLVPVSPTPPQLEAFLRSDFAKELDPPISADELQWLQEADWRDRVPTIKAYYHAVLSHRETKNR